MTAAQGLRGRWAAWVTLWDRQERPTVLAAIRMLVASVLLYDFLWIRALGLVQTLFAPQEAGGFGDVQDRNPVPEIYRWFPHTGTTAEVAWWGIVGCLTAFGVGFATPLAALGFVLLSSQLSQVLPLGDRGIDMLLRNVFVLLAFSPCGRVWSVDAWIARHLGRPFAAEQPAWARHLLILQVAGMYFSAGIQKTALAWTPFGGFSALYSILQDPSIARHRFGWLADYYPLTQLASASTIAFEYTACLVPLAYWFRATRDRPGRLRRWFNAARPVRVWLALGVCLHVGIAATMQLGIFPWAMLSLYPAFFHPDEWSAARGWRPGRKGANARAAGVNAT